jgi:mannitol-specific phosphotransferase system IIBC component
LGNIFLFLQGGFVICELRIKRFFVIYGFVVSLGIKNIIMGMLMDNEADETLQQKIEKVKAKKTMVKTETGKTSTPEKAASDKRDFEMGMQKQWESRGKEDLKNRIDKAKKLQMIDRASKKTKMLMDAKAKGTAMLDEDEEDSDMA